MIKTRVGSFLRWQRCFIWGISLRQCAKKLGVSAPFWSDVENGNRPLSDLRLKQVVKVFGLMQRSGRRCPDLALYDAAAKDYDVVPLDIAAYIKKRRYVQVALRIAENANASIEEWDVIADYFFRKSDRTLWPDYRPNTQTAAAMAEFLTKRVKELEIEDEKDRRRLDEGMYK